MGSVTITLLQNTAKCRSEDRKISGQYIILPGVHSIESMLLLLSSLVVVVVVVGGAFNSLLHCIETILLLLLIVDFETEMTFIVYISSNKILLQL